MLALSIILLVLLTTARHEGSDGLVAWAQGATIHEVRLLPGVSPDLGFYFGYVSRDDGGTWLIGACVLGILHLRRSNRFLISD